MDNGTKSLLIKLNIMALTALATYLHVNLPDAQLMAFSADIADGALLLFGWWRSYGMKLVPKAAVAIAPHTSQDASAPVGSNVAGKVVGALLVAMILPILPTSHSFAADNLPSVIKVAPVVAIPVNPCTPTSCSGFYVGASMGGAGSNADIIGNGLNGSVFAGGGIPMLQGGYQYSTPNWLIAGEAGVGMQISTTAQVAGIKGNGNGLFAYQIVKVGGNLSALLGNTSAPISIPPKLADALISPYLLTGAVERSFAQGWASGAGALFDIGPNSFVDVKYMYVNYGPSNNGALQLKSENIVSVGFNYKFK